jgi:hypothetical protein
LPIADVIGSPRSHEGARPASALLPSAERIKEAHRYLRVSSG